MDVLLELLAQIIFEGAFEVSRSSKVPLWLRWILAVSLFGLILLFGAFLAYGGFSLISGNAIGGSLILAIGLGVTIFSVYQLWKFLKTVKTNYEKPRQKA